MMRTSKKVVIAAIASITAFTVAETWLLYSTGTGYPDTFIVSWFTFWSVELAALSGIKRAEIKQNPYKVVETREEEVG